MIAFVLAVAGCTSSNRRNVAMVAEPTCITDTPTCNLPCWEGITPGVTQAGEALELLRASSQVEPGSIAVDQRGELVPDSEATIYWHNTGSPPIGEEWLVITEGNLAIVRNGIVDSIQLLVDPSSCHSTVGEVVERYGIPEKVLFAPRGAVPHEVWHTLDLYYFSRGIAFVAHADRLPQRWQPVGVVYAFAPQSSLAVIEVGPQRYLFDRFITVEDGFGLADWLTSLENWTGFADGDP